MEVRSNNEVRYFPFIIGELVDLCVPNKTAILEDHWTDWFNNTKELQGTQHGIYPNHRNTQEQILKSIEDDRSKIVLLICEKKFGKAIGVVALQNINYQARSAEIALNASSPNKVVTHAFLALEAMALITQHAFEEVGLQRVYGGQAFPTLRSWNKMTELIGYRCEGVLRRSFVRGQTVEDTLSISCLYTNYLKIKEYRGSLWGTNKIIRSAIKKQPRVSYAEILSSNMQELERDYFSFLSDE